MRLKKILLRSLLVILALLAVIEVIAIIVALPKSAPEPPLPPELTKGKGGGAAFPDREERSCPKGRWLPVRKALR